jgi:hypothetical protein
MPDKDRTSDDECARWVDSFVFSSPESQIEMARNVLDTAKSSIRMRRALIDIQDMLKKAGK